MFISLNKTRVTLHSLSVGIQFTLSICSDPEVAWGVGRVHGGTKWNDLTILSGRRCSPGWVWCDMNLSCVTSAHAHAVLEVVKMIDDDSVVKGHVLVVAKVISAWVVDEDNVWKNGKLFVGGMKFLGSGIFATSDGTLVDMSKS